MNVRQDLRILSPPPRMLFLTGFHEVPLHGRMDLTEGEDGAAVGACLGNSQYEAIAASGSGSVSGSKVLGFVDTDTDADADGFIFILELLVLNVLPQQFSFWRSGGRGVGELRAGKRRRKGR